MDKTGKRGGNSCLYFNGKSFTASVPKYSEKPKKRIPIFLSFISKNAHQSYKSEILLIYVSDLYNWKYWPFLPSCQRSHWEGTSVRIRWYFLFPLCSGAKEGWRPPSCIRSVPSQLLIEKGKIQEAQLGSQPWKKDGIVGLVGCLFPHSFTPCPQTLLAVHIGQVHISLLCSPLALPVPLGCSPGWWWWLQHIWGGPLPRRLAVEGRLAPGIRLPPPNYGGPPAFIGVHNQLCPPIPSILRQGNLQSMQR